MEVEIVKDTSVSETVDTLRVIFSRHGLCDTIVSDNATCFTAREFKDFLYKHGIHHITSPPYVPSSNGQGERCVRVFKELLKKNNSGSLKTRLAKSPMHYRTVPHSTTHVVPSVALNNLKYITLKDRINPRFAVSQSALNKVKMYFNLRLGMRFSR